MWATTSSVMRSISSIDMPGSILTYLSDLYSLSKWSRSLNTDPLNVLDVSKTTSPMRKPRSSIGIWALSRST